MNTIYVINFLLLDLKFIKFIYLFFIYNHYKINKNFRNVLNSDFFVHFL